MLDLVNMVDGVIIRGHIQRTAKRTQVAHNFQLTMTSLSLEKTSLRAIWTILKDQNRDAEQMMELVHQSLQRLCRKSKLVTVVLLCFFIIWGENLLEQAL